MRWGRGRRRYEELPNNVGPYLTENHMNHFVNFSGDWKEPGHFCIEIVDVMFLLHN